ncbi:hypothetical protein AB1A87_13585, partial [Stenotrophomonas maltophilia]|uniref:hypothetical protein n=1 Tax=Stenotrophomonas maltophilia TaxID=40324 RepID=UPI0034556D4B
VCFFKKKGVVFFCCFVVWGVVFVFVFCVCFLFVVGGVGGGGGGVVDSGVGFAGGVFLFALVFGGGIGGAVWFGGVVAVA